MKIVILPGLDGTGRLLTEFARELGDAREVQIVSYPVNLTAYAELEVWLEPRLPSEDYALVAESFSGPLAIRIARRNTSALKHLILVATFARRPVRAPAALLKVLRRAPHLPDIMARASLPFVMGGERPPGFLAAYIATLRETPWSTLVDRLQAVMTVDVRDELAGIGAPIAYVQARHDRLIPASIGADFKPYCDQFHQLPGPHFLLQARPQDVAGLVRRMLARPIRPAP